MAYHSSRLVQTLTKQLTIDKESMKEKRVPWGKQRKRKNEFTAAISHASRCDCREQGDPKKRWSGKSTLLLRISRWPIDPSENDLDVSWDIE